MDERPADVDRRIVEQFRRGGEIEGIARDRLLLLTTRGAKSGRARTTPLMFHADRGALLVMASNDGSTRTPHWHANLLADPAVIVELGLERFPAIATPLRGREREVAWRAVTTAHPFFLEHQVRANRQIPVVALHRA